MKCPELLISFPAKIFTYPNKINKKSLGTMSYKKIPKQE